ncbi:uncharacterized protein LOC120718235 isoform X3 [Simochromis diagramma]|uniref:uncharacterized protein LOC120718235 isoform X3 n=1 Tax=Simochromis diagramma TaxID=43689 RepID=UPI001A7E7B4B|nr:uncharacterized protein LOC120718235 isoform X3 [Simochromis diagramma]
MGALLLFILVIIAVYFIWRRRFKRRGAGPRSAHCMTELQDTSNQSDDDPTYATIPDLPPTGTLPDSTYSLIGSTFHAGSNKGLLKQNDHTYATITHLPHTTNTNDSPYSLVGESFSGNQKGSEQLTDSTYVLLQKPKSPRPV